MNFALGGYNTYKAAEDRRWNRGAEHRAAQSAARERLREELERIDVALTGLPEIKMGLHGYSIVTDPPTECASLERSLPLLSERIADQDLAAVLHPNLQIIVDYLSTWRRTLDCQSINAAKPARSAGSSRAELENLHRMVEGQVAMRRGREDVEKAVRSVTDALNMADQRVPVRRGIKHRWSKKKSPAPTGTPKVTID